MITKYSTDLDKNRPMQMHVAGYLCLLALNKYQHLVRQFNETFGHNTSFSKASETVDTVRSSDVPSTLFYTLWLATADSFRAHAISQSSFKYDSTLLGGASFLQLGCFCMDSQIRTANLNLHWQVVLFML